jgi:hypothetical protein
LAGNKLNEFSERNFNTIAAAILADDTFVDIEYLLSLPEIDINKAIYEGRAYLIWAAVK